MDKLSDFLHEIVENLQEGYLSTEGAEQYVAQGEAEQYILDALKMISHAAAAGDTGALKNAIESLHTLLYRTLKPNLKSQLYQLVIALYMHISDNQNALSCTKDYEASGLDNSEALYRFAAINLGIGTDDSLLRAVAYADRYAETAATDAWFSAVRIKSDALTALGKYQEALTAIDLCLPKVNPYERRMLIMKQFQILMMLHETEKAFQLIKKENIISLGYSLGSYYKNAFESITLAIDAAKAYLVKHPQDVFVYGLIAELCDDLDEKITYYTLADEDRYAEEIMRLLNERGDPSDAKKYFELARQIFFRRGKVSHHFLQQILYSSFARFDRGLIKKLLAAFEMQDPSYGCGLTLIGKAYECGLGVKRNLKKAVKYYYKAKRAGNKICDCGTFFIANCLLYGMGLKQDKEQAKLDILSIIDRRVEADRYCLYAVFALEGDARFPKEKAKKYLSSQSQYPACNLLLYKLTKGTEEAAAHLAKFKERLKESDYLERQWYTKYVDNCDAAYVHFVTN